ncbi:MAG TPA: glycosyltransferase [Cyanobacteria bacterium UBA8156]|jgi:N-acetylglucosaminyldiphosphoundecaprenol N-acetyl-beta-D-mannosaminyltransferase|nr:glycosyltransferase [Cyanobacteria bacterium UBA8156]
MLDPAPTPALVLSVPVDVHGDYGAWATACALAGRGLQVVTLNSEMVMQARRNSALAAAIAQADLVVPDGAGVVLYLRSRGIRVARCPGIDLAENLCRRVVQAGKRVFWIGGRPGVLARVRQQTFGDWPEGAIAGAYHGYFDAAGEAEILTQLQATQPAVVLVGLGAPRQEFWIAQHRHLCPGAVWVGVGGSFDVWSGEKPRAPQWMQQNHLEWLFRLYCEPRRWQRMLLLPQFVWQVVWEPWRREG